MGKMILTVTGLDGEVELRADRVVINRKGLWNAIKFGLNATREIPLSAISEIGFKNANALMFGEIDFIVGGRVTMAGKKKGVNPTAVKFKKDKQKQFEMLKEKVFELMEQQSRQRQA